MYRHSAHTTHKTATYRKLRPEVIGVQMYKKTMCSFDEFVAKNPPSNKSKNYPPKIFSSGRLENPAAMDNGLAENGLVQSCRHAMSPLSPRCQQSVTRARSVRLKLERCVPVPMFRSVGSCMRRRPSISPRMPQVAFPQAKKKTKGKEQSNLGAFNIKPKYPPHADDALVRQKVRSAVCALAVAKYNRSCSL